MKPLFTIAFLLIALSSQSQSQIGGRIGTGFTNLQNIDEESNTYTWRQGLYGGLVYNYRITSELVLQPEINFSSEGGRKKEIQLVPVGTYVLPGTTTEQPIYANLKTATIIHYLEVPVLAKLTGGMRVKYFMCIGPYVSFLLDAKRKASGNSVVYLDKAGTKTLQQNIGLPANVSSHFNYQSTINSRIKNANFGFLAGCGLEVTAGPGSFFTECRLKLGMTNIDAYPSEDGKHQTTSFSLSAGYLFNLQFLPHAHK